MPQYKKAFDIGTYTGNGGVYRIGMPTLRIVGPSGKQVAGSTRFRLGVPNYLTRTPATTTSQTTSTWSFWVKKTALATEQEFLTAATSNHSSNPTISYIGFNGSDQLVYFSINNNVQTWYKSTTLAFRDTSVWTHFIVVTDTTNATSSNRIRIYVNGSEVTSWSNDSQPSQNATGFFNSSSATHVIGREAVRNRYPLDGYMSEVYFIDGQALTPSSFGELNSDGIWVPKAYSGTYGTNGFYLPMNSSSNYATDQSGNGNNWTPTGFNTTTANSSYDIMTDSSTDYLSGSMTTANNAGNYCTINPGDTYATAGSWSVTNGGLYLTSSATLGSVRGTIGFSSGKWYWEVKYINGNSSEIAGISTPTSTSAGGSAGGIGYYTNGNIYVNGSASAYGTSVSANDIIGVAVDMDNGKIWFSKNGTWQNSGDPAAGTNPGTTGLSGTYYPGFEDAASGTNATFEANFGQRAFSYTPPAGYKSLNTYNITRPADSSLWFYGDTPDLMWIKNRSTAANNVVTDTVRGVGLNLVTNARAPDLSYPAVSEMNKFGMSIINDSVSIVNGSGNSHVYWGWKANGSTTVTDTSGTITSQVSANRQAGFSIVSWVYNSSGGTIGHGLGAAPSFIIQRSRTTGYNWDVYHVSLGPTKRLTLNTTSASETFTGPWNDTSPTSSVFSSGASWWTNGDSMITYCWTAIPGYSAFGSYVGSGGADGPYVYLGFRPRWLLVKRTDAANDWLMWDSTRDTYNLMQNIIYANATTAESTYVNDKLDFVSNGIKLRNVGSAMNASGGTYIYAAFAESPFKFARAR